MSFALKSTLELGCQVGLIGLLALGGCRSHAAAHAQDLPRPGSSAHAPAPPSDPELAAAERSAIATLSEFRAALARADTSAQFFEIEAVLTDGALSERLWLLDVRPVADGFEGSVEALPQVLKSLQQGQKLHVPLEAVVDWSYEDRGKPRGGETRRLAARRKREAELKDALTHCGEQRFADGCAALGERYASGTFGEARLDVAVQLYSAACAGGSAYGCNAAGWATLHGRGTAQDSPGAAAFFARGCTTGAEHPFACDSRGFALVSGLAGTSRDLVLGQRFLKKACARGVPQSCLLLELLSAKKLRVGPKLERACDINFAEQVSLCAIDKDPEACFLAGSAFETGVCGAHRSRTQSAELLSAAAAFGATWPAQPGT
jgi:uncharacterized protein YegJ (DUF2314 family)